MSLLRAQRRYRRRVIVTALIMLAVVRPVSSAAAATSAVPVTCRTTDVRASPADDPSLGYDGAVPVTPTYLRLRANGRSQLLRRGRRVTPPIYDAITQLSTGLFLVQQGTCEGLLNDRGVAVLPTTFSSITVLSPRSSSMEPSGSLYVVARLGPDDPDVTILRLHRRTGRIVAQRSIDATYLERKDFDGRSFVEFQSSKLGYGLLDGNLRVLIDGQQSIEAIGLGAGGVDPMYWIATSENSATVLDPAGTVAARGTNAKVIWFYDGIMRAYIVVRDSRRSRCQFVTRRGRQRQVVRAVNYTESGCPEFANRRVAVAAWPPAANTWKLLRLGNGAIRTTATLNDVNDVVDLGPPRNEPVNAPHEFLVRGASIGVVNTRGISLATGYDDVDVRCGFVFLRRGGLWYAYDKRGRIELEGKAITFFPFSC